MADLPEAYYRAEQTLRECVIHIARGCRSSGPHDSVAYESTIDNRLAEMRQTADDHAMALASAASSQWMARARDAEANVALCAADTSYADLRQEVEFVRSAVEQARSEWLERGASEDGRDVRIGEVITTLERIAAAIPGEANRG